MATKFQAGDKVTVDGVRGKGFDQIDPDVPYWVVREISRCYAGDGWWYMGAKLSPGIENPGNRVLYCDEQVLRPFEG